MPTTSKTPIGLKLPLQNGKAGYFDQSTDSFTAYKMNIINLLRTRPGERRMNPTFGSGLWNIVFEQNDDFIQTKINKVISDDITKWVPGVTVNSVSVSIDSTITDANELYITVNFSISSINQSDSVSIVLNRSIVQ